MEYATRSLLLAILIANVVNLLLQIPFVKQGPITDGEGEVSVEVVEAVSDWRLGNLPTLFVELEHNGTCFWTPIADQGIYARFNKTFTFRARFHDTIIVRVRDGSYEKNSLRGWTIISPSEVSLGRPTIYNPELYTNLLLTIDWKRL